MSKWMSTLALAGVVAVGLPACATKKFVRNSVGEVNGKVDNLTQSVEETQERTRKNEGAINDVNTKAQAAQGAADAAQQAANTAGNDARTAGARATEVGARTDALDKASKRIVFTVVISEDEGQDRRDDQQAQSRSERRLHRDRGPHRQRRRQGNQREDRHGARRGREALPLRAASNSAAQDERDQLREREARGVQQDQRRSRAEPARRDQGARLEHPAFGSMPAGRDDSARPAVCT